MRTWLGLWLTSLVVVAVLASGLTTRAQMGPLLRSQEPRIVSGEDVGFKVEGVDWNGRPIGTLVIRVDGKWLETGVEMDVRPLR
jgi:hypothetical protein